MKSQLCIKVREKKLPLSTFCFSLNLVFMHENSSHYDPSSLSIDFYLFLYISRFTSANFHRNLLHFQLATFFKLLVLIAFPLCAS